MLDVLKNFHRVVFSVKDLCHGLHVALRDALGVPQGLQFRKGIRDGLLQLLFVLPRVGFVGHFVYFKKL